jgi:putative membrane protein
MSEPISPDGHSSGAPERLHPLFLLKGLGGSLRRVGGAYALIAYLAVSGRWSTATLTAAAFLLIGIMGVLVYWARFEYRVGRSDIRIDSGVLSRRHRSIPFDRIQDVDITQGPLARLLGLAEVKFETGGGGSSPNSEEGVLQAITLERAEEIRALVRASRSAAAPLPAMGAGEGERPVYALGLKRLLLAGVFNFSLAIFAALIGLSQTAGQALGFDPFSEAFWRELLSASAPVEDYIEAHRGAAVAAGLAIFVLLGLATGLVRTVLRDWGFRLDRTPTGLRRRRGLLTRTDVALAVRRVQAVLVTTGPVRGAFGWAAMFVQNLAREEGGGGNHLVAPLADERDVAAILAELGWRPLPDAPQWRRVSFAYVWIFALAISPLLLAVVVQATIVWPVAVAYGLALLGAVAVRALAWRRIAFALDGERLLIRGGWWRQRLVVLPVARIQSIELKQDFVSRWFGVASLNFGVAGGSARGEIIPAIPSGTARQLRAQLLVSPA